MKVGTRLHRILLKLADSILPPAPRTDGTLEDVVRHALILLRYMPRSSALVFLWGMRLLNWAPLWRLRGLRPLTALSTEAARRHLLGVNQSRWLPVRLLMYGPLGLFMSCYFDQDYVHQVLGYAPAPFVARRVDLRRQWTEGREPGAQDEIHHLRVIPP
jgi:hypothetical protein